MIKPFFHEVCIIADQAGQTRPPRLFSAVTWWTALLFFILFSGSLDAQSPSTNVLTEVAIGDGSDYVRLAFTFKKPLESYVVRRDDVDRLVVDFGPVQRGQAALPPPHEFIESVNLEMVEGRLTATVQLASIRFELRHFSSRDKYSCLLDIKNLSAAPVEPILELGEMAPLILPSLAEEAKRLHLLIETPADDGPAENLYRRLLGELVDWNHPAALADAELFLANFPEHPRAEEVSFLKAEAGFLTGPPAETYAAAVENWKSALERWPQSVMAPRAKFMLAEADRILGYNNEAAARFKILADEAGTEGGGDYIYPQLATLRAADLLLNMGLIDEARAILEPTIAAGQADRLGLEAYARMGMADFYQGFFSQGNEIFREALGLNPRLYRSYPDMLYGAGEGYHYLDRPDISRQFLYHALNLMPEHPKADVIMARIGDDYRKEGRDREAMAIYGAARRNFPNSDGGLISQVRLADMGALHSFFNQDNVFNALERGSRQATVEMYKKIVESDSASPLMQLAQLKIGTAMAEDGEHAEAVKWLRELEMNSPHSTLLPEALPLLSQALADEIRLRAELEEWQAISDLYADNSSYLRDEDRPEALRTVARAYEQLGRYADAREVWRSLEESDPERRLNRYKGLVINSLKMGRPMEAFEFIKEMAPSFPEEQPWVNLQLAQVGRDLARPRNEQASADLLKLVESIEVEPVRRDALADAIEIEINSRRYERAVELMDRYRRDYPEDDLTPEYILTQAKIADYEKRPEAAWNYLSDFRLNFPDDARVPDLLKGQIKQAEELGRVDDALRFMELYRGHFPGSPETRAMMLEKMQKEWSLGRYDDSRDTLAAFRRDYAGDPIIPELLIRRSNQDWEKGRYEDARQALDELLANYPQDPRVLDFLISQAERDWDKERYEASQWAMDQLLRLYPKDARLADLLLQRAEGDWGRGRTAAAQKDWADFRRAFPDDPRVGSSYLDQYRKTVAAGQTAAAAALAGEIRQTQPKNTTLQGNLILEEAKDYLAAGRTDEALARWDLFRQNYPEDPRLPDLLLIQARQELKIGRQDQALAHYLEILDKYPRHPRTPDVYLELAAAETKLNLRLPAWEHLGAFNRQFVNHPGRPKALLDQAELGRQLGRLDEAAELYRGFRRDYPDDPQAPPTYLAQARLEISAGRPEAAIATLEAGVLAQPALDNDANVQALLTDLYLEDGQVENWAAIVERNLDRVQNTPANAADRFLKYNQLGQVYQELGRNSEAERNYDKALANRSPGTSSETLYAMANAFKKMGRTEKRIALLNIIVSSGDDFWRKVATDELAAMGSAPAPVGS